MLVDPPSTSVVAAATIWIEDLVLGTIGTTIAVLAVATVGLMMLGGRWPLRRGLTVLAGCFILFGASAIVAGIQSVRVGPSSGEQTAAQLPVPSPSPLENLTVSSDPYAGASVPTS